MAHKRKQKKKIKYRSLCIEIQRLWNMKCMVIPVTIGATVIVREGLKKNVEAIPAKHSINSLHEQPYLERHT